jgi:hypothetical protein
MNLIPCFFRCALAFLGREPDSDRQIVEMFRILEPGWDSTDILMVEAYVRLAELGLPAPPPTPLDKWGGESLGKLQYRRPDLIERIRRPTEKRGIPDDARSP